MAAPRPRNVLLALSGMSPQVITETWYCLVAHRKVTIHELHVVTTKEGADLLRDGNAARGIPALKQALKECGASLKARPPKFDPSSHIHVGVDDSSLSRRGRKISDVICDRLQELTSDEHATVHASLAGGRKTMSASLAIAMTMFARAEDSLTHVVVDPVFESSGAFFPASRADSGLLRLIDYPFIRLRPKLGDILASHDIDYSSLVERSEKHIRALVNPQAVLDVGICKLVVGGEIELTLDPQECAVYAWIFAADGYVEFSKADFPAEYEEEIESYYAMCRKTTLERGTTFFRPRMSVQDKTDAVVKAISSSSGPHGTIRKAIRNPLLEDLIVVATEGRVNKRRSIRLPYRNRRLVEPKRRRGAS